jgi:hypothetical protein
MHPLRHRRLTCCDELVRVVIIVSRDFARYAVHTCARARRADRHRAPAHTEMAAVSFGFRGAYARRMRNASCCCGRLKASCEGEPVRISMCHCLNCQRRSGSVFAVQARWPAERVTLEGPSHEYVRVGDEGGRATFHFCPTCGTTVYYVADAMPGMIAIPVGVFADPTFPPPRISVYNVRRHPWAVMPALDVENFD